MNLGEPLERYRALYSGDKPGILPVIFLRGQEPERFCKG